MARKTQRLKQEQSLEQYYAQWIAEWFTETQDLGVPTAQEQLELWELVNRTNRTLSRNTISFIEDWFSAVNSAQRPEDLFTSQTVIERITVRERQKKGARARLKPGNRQALDAWSGAAGTGRYNFRWNYVVQHLQDLYDAREQN